MFMFFGDLIDVWLKHILEREEIWNKWKNEGCPNFAREKRPPASIPAKPKRLKPLCSDFIVSRSLSSLASNGLDASAPQPVSVMGKLCQVNHGNLEACRDPGRQFLPSMKDFFDEAIDQMDPANQVEKQYWLIAQHDWAWKALRLLAKQSPHYFMQMNQNAKPINEYLEGICTKLGKGNPITARITSSLIELTNDNIKSLLLNNNDNKRPWQNKPNCSRPNKQ